MRESLRTMIPVLFIAFEFPPVSTAGVHRSAKLVKYLRDFGIDPIVITLNAQDAAEAFAAPIDRSLDALVNAGATLYALPAPARGPSPTTKLGKFLSVFSRVEDTLANRLRPALARALPTIIARHAPRAVYASLPPFSTGGLAAEIAKKEGIPLVVDMRDGWSHWCAGAFPSYLHWARIHAKERKLFESAHRVVTVTRQLADIFQRSHPHLARERFCVVPNGYDGALDIPDVYRVDRKAAQEPVTIGYVGNYYYTPEARQVSMTPWWRRPGHRKIQYQPVREDWLYRSPYFFLRALQELRRRDPSVGGRVRFVHVGRIPDWLQSMVEELGLSDIVVFRGVVPHAQILPITKSFDALLCTSVKVDGGEDYALASKTFDYLLAGRPIVGFVTRGAQREFLEQSGAALLADPDDQEAGVRCLASLVRGDFEVRPNRAFLERYERRASAQEMAKILRGAAEASLSPRSEASRRSAVGN